MCADITKWEPKARMIKVIGVFKLVNYEVHTISTSHYVIMLNNVIYDYTPNQFAVDEIEYIENVPAILKYDQKLSKALDCNIYSCSQYFVVIV